MGVSLGAQAQGFFSSLLLGAALALLYDLLRAIRLRRRTSNALTGMLDALYCLLLALLSFLFALRVGGGELRLYMLLAALSGAALYFRLGARWLRPLWAFWAEVLFSLLQLAAAPFRLLKKFYGKLHKLCKRYFLFFRSRTIIKTYERSARKSLRRQRQKEGSRHGGAEQN